MMLISFGTAWRRLRRQPLLTTINVVGLVAAVTSCLLIALYVTDELSYDRFHRDADRIYRVVSENSVVTPGTLAPIFKADLPGVDAVARVYTGKLWGRSALLSSGTESFYVEDFYLSDPSLFQVFTFPLAEGSEDLPLAGPNSAILSGRIARRLFGSTDPIGRSITIDGTHNFTVEGVLRDVPSASHLRFDLIVPFDFYRVWRDAPDGPEQWFNHAFVTYVKVRDGADVDGIQEQLNDQVRRVAGQDYGWEYQFQPLTDIHLYSHLKRELSENGNVGYVYLFSFLAFLILGIAVANFINLSTARAIHHTGDVGIRKILGADRGRLFLHFVSESILLSFVACVIAYGLSEISIPALNTLTGKHIASGALVSGRWLIVLPLFVLTIGVVTGLYPAISLSRIRPIEALKGGAADRSHAGLGLRRILVVAQFTIAVGLIVCTFVVREQLSYVQATDLGFSGEQVLTLSTRRDDNAGRSLDVLKARLRSYMGILDVSASSQTPGRGLFQRTITAAGMDKGRPILSLWADGDFLKTFRIQLVAGRDFDPNRPSDAQQSFILTETAVRYLGFDTPEAALGQRVTTDGKSGTVIGVAEDFHFMSLHAAIEPTVIHPDPTRYSYLSVRLDSRDIPFAIEQIGEVWKEVLPGRPFEYFFVDEDFGHQYAAEQRLSAVFGVFSMLAIVVAGLGLLGLAAFITGRRTKEIGIRKVLGASTPSVMVHIGREFVILSLLGNVIAWPAAYLGMDAWLVTFAYRTAPEWWAFVLAGLIVLTVALVAVALVARKAASANPVESLRYE